MISLSEVAAADGDFQLWYAVDSRIAALRKNYGYVKKNFGLRARCDENFEHKYRDHMVMLKEMRTRLDKSSLIDHRELGWARWWFRKLGSLEDQVKTIFGEVVSGDRASPTEPWIQEYLKNMAAKAAQGRISEHRFRVIEEITNRTRQGWFVIFNTLTVNAREYDKVFAVGATAWKNYVRRVHREVGKEIYGSVRKADRESKHDPFHTYFGVVECGNLRGRLHIHVVHCIRAMPRNWQADPNRGLRVPSRREIYAMKEFWPHGWSTPIACRFSDFDAFGKMGWKWPVVAGGRGVPSKPLEGKAPAALAHYMVKYLTKNYYDERGSYQWRVRMSRNFGTQRLREAVKMVSTDALLTILRLNQQVIMIGEVKLPRRRMRLEMIREIVRRTKSCARKQDKHGLNAWMRLRLLMAVKAQPPIGERLQSLIQTSGKYNSPNTGLFRTRISMRTAVSEMESAIVRIFVVEEERFKAVRGNCYEGREGVSRTPIGGIG